MTALEAIALVSNTTWACSFEFPGQGQRETPVTGCTGMLRTIQLLKEEQAAQYRQNMASLLEKYLDADMGLADDITDRALQAHMADLIAAKEPSAEDGGDIPRPKYRDITKELGHVIKQIGAAPKYHRLFMFMGGVNTAVKGMPTKTYRRIQVT